MIFAGAIRPCRFLICAGAPLYSNTRTPTVIINDYFRCCNR
ncbi:hypothetical protein CLOSTASPAR_00247 [[Clostridium] asparagiforme DSM 15981]|uniref:Uncharacterized protein n=1 Tax=[Clostridium] asparagiforme DSM 15981 TaxID=518636 RepID=C0CTE9_9FIRM|nr:hypothetical protein CLOSTASPAR_00247 [[Clostridium] asparagiforme DSM 15981]